MIDLYFVYCIDDKELQEKTKTQLIGLQKLIYSNFSLWLLLIPYEVNELSQWV